MHHTECMWCKPLRMVCGIMWDMSDIAHDKLTKVIRPLCFRRGCSHRLQQQERPLQLLPESLHRYGEWSTLGKPNMVRKDKIGVTIGRVVSVLDSLFHLFQLRPTCARSLGGQRRRLPILVLKAKRKVSFNILDVKAQLCSKSPLHSTLQDMWRMLSKVLVFNSDAPQCAERCRKHIKKSGGPCWRSALSACVSDRNSSELRLHLLPWEQLDLYLAQCLDKQGRMQWKLHGTERIVNEMIWRQCDFRSSVCASGSSPKEGPYQGSSSHNRWKASLGSKFANRVRFSKYCKVLSTQVSSKTRLFISSLVFVVLLQSFAWQICLRQEGEARQPSLRLLWLYYPWLIQATQPI